MASIDKAACVRTMSGRPNRAAVIEPYIAVQRSFLCYLWGAKFAAGSVRVTPGIVVFPLRPDHVGTTLLAGCDADRAAKSYGRNAERLLAAKRRYDPDNVFRSAIPLPANATMAHIP
jgi:hypothetical protein